MRPWSSPREAAKKTKSYFLSRQSTKRGVMSCSPREKELFLLFSFQICSRSFVHLAEGKGLRPRFCIYDSVPDLLYDRAKVLDVIKVVFLPENKSVQIFLMTATSDIPVTFLQKLLNSLVQHVKTCVKFVDLYKVPIQKLKKNFKKNFKFTIFAKLFFR